MKITAHQNESTDQLVRRFRKTVTRSGILSEVRRRRWFIGPSEERRMEKKKAIRRARRRTREGQR